MEQKLSAIKKYYLYSKERFPIFGVLLYAGSLFFVSYYFANFYAGSSPVNYSHAIAGFIVIFLVLLHLRIFDEHKDYEKDKIAYPERMLSRGDITLDDLKKLLYGVLFLEMIISLFLGRMQFFVLIVVVLWSFLMFLEFFVPVFLNRHMGLYLLSHQLLVPIVVLYAFSERFPLTKLHSYSIDHLILFMIGTMAATVTYEIARKTWSADREQEHADSYTKEWGKTMTVLINQVTALIALGAYLYFYIIFHINPVSITIAVFLYAIFLAIGILFIFKPENKISKLIEAAGILFMLGLFVNSAVAFALFI